MKRYRGAHRVALASLFFYIIALSASPNRSSVDAIITTFLLVLLTYISFYIYYVLVDAGVIKSWAKGIEKYQHQEPKELRGSNLNYYNKKFFDYNQNSNFTITQVVLVSAIFLLSALGFLYFLNDSASSANTPKNAPSSCDCVDLLMLKPDLKTNVPMDNKTFDKWKKCKKYHTGYATAVLKCQKLKSKK